MVNITVSEKNENNRYVAYVYGSLYSHLEACGAKAELSFDADRTNLNITADKRFDPYIRRFVEEKLAEVIAVGYKYTMFKKQVRPAGLGAEDLEILLAALIAADFREDKNYIFTRIKEMKVYSVDGFYAFRLKMLREKWQSVINCVPGYFTEDRLAAFMGYLLKDDCGEKIFIRDAEIYDNHYNKLRRASLIEGGISDMNTVREIILSCAGEIECVTALPARQENFLRRYYSGRISFL